MCRSVTIAVAANEPIDSVEYSCFDFLLMPTGLTATLKWMFHCHRKCHFYGLAFSIAFRQLLSSSFFPIFSFAHRTHTVISIRLGEQYKDEYIFCAVISMCSECFDHLSLSVSQRSARIYRANCTIFVLCILLTSRLSSLIVLFSHYVRSFVRTISIRSVVFISFVMFVAVCKWKRARSFMLVHV